MRVLTWTGSLWKDTVTGVQSPYWHLPAPWTIAGAREGKAHPHGWVFCEGAYPVPNAVPSSLEFRLTSLSGREVVQEKSCKLCGEVVVGEVEGFLLFRGTIGFATTRGHLYKRGRTLIVTYSDVMQAQSPDK